MLSILEGATIWNLSRKALDGLFGHYKIRMNIIRNFGIDEKMSIIDMGCGMGQYSTMTDGKYLGIDLNKNYIQTARKLYGNKNKKFSSEDINNINFEKSLYDVALLIDITHHLSNKETEKLLQKLNYASLKYIVISDPVMQSKYNFLGRFFVYLDQGKHIRAKKELVDMINKYFYVKKIVPLGIMWTEGVCILARPRINQLPTEK